MSARHGFDDIGFDEADGRVKRTVLIRSPTPTKATTSGMDELSSLTSTRLQQHYEQEERGYTHRVKSASIDSSNYNRHSSRRSNRRDDKERPRSYSDRHHHSGHGNAETRPQYERRTDRTSSLEVQDSIREMYPSSQPARSPRVISPSQDTASFADEEVDNVEYSHGSPRSHRSSSNASSSPKASSRSGSPSKKPRYGRKHYRANASRK